MDKKNHLIIKISELFLENGFRSITMDDISSNLKVSKKTLYELFGNKSQLIAYCIEFILKEFKKIGKENDNKATNAIQLFYMNFEQIISITSYAAQYKNLNELEYYYKSIYNIEMPRVEATILNLFQVTLLRGMEEGVFSNKFNAKIISKIFVRGYLTTLNEPANTNDERELAIKTFKIHFISGLCTEKGRKILESVYNHKFIK